MCVQASAAPSAVTNRCFVTIILTRMRSVFRPDDGPAPGDAALNDTTSEHHDCTDISTDPQQRLRETDKSSGQQ